MRIRTLIPLASAVALMVPASAGAAGWVTGAPLSPAGRVAIEPKVALTAAGERILAWQEFQAGTHDIERTVARIAPAGADFGSPQAFPSGNGEDLSLTSGGDGTVALVWTDSRSSSGADLHIARRTPGKPGFAEATPFALGTFTRDTPHAVVVNGDVYVALDTNRVDGNVETTTVRVVRLPAGSDQLQPVNGPGGANLDTASFNESNQPSTTVDASQLAVDSGTVHVVWEHLQDAPAGTTASTTIVRRATAAVGGGTFGTPVLVDASSINSGRAESEDPIVVAGRGRADVAWLGGGQINFQQLTSGGLAQHIATFATSLHAGIDPSGVLVLGWQAFATPDNAEAVFADTVVPGGQPATPTRLTPLGGNRQLDDFVVGGDGSVLAVPDQANFFSLGDETERVQAAFRAASGAGAGGAEFGPLEDVSGTQDRTGDAAFDSAAGALGAGRALIAWSADDGSGVTNSRIFLSERDATPPTLGSITVPRGAVAGRTVALSAAATDGLSAVTLTWDFGDGAGARGTSVTHTYAAPETYMVRVTARDGAGNEVKQTRALVVSAPADRAPPVINRVGVTNRRFVVARGRTALIAARRHRTPSGTTFRLTLDERATVVLTLARTGKGGHTMGTILRGGRGPGTVSIPFSGRLEGRALSAGGYVASVVAVDGSGNRSRPRTVAFTVVSR